MVCFPTPGRNRPSPLSTLANRKAPRRGQGRPTEKCNERVPSVFFRFQASLRWGDDEGTTGGPDMVRRIARLLLVLAASGSFLAAAPDDKGKGDEGSRKGFVVHEWGVWRVH